MWDRIKSRKAGSIEEVGGEKRQVLSDQIQGRNKPPTKHRDNDIKKIWQN